jgi:hypothetical protein
VEAGATASFTVAPNSGYQIAAVAGCGGGLDGATYTTGPITANCTVSASFSLLPPSTYVVTATAGPGGSISPPSRTVEAGATASFTVTPNSGYQIAAVTGCGGSLDGTTYFTGPITANCTVSASFALVPVSVPNVVGLSQSAAASAIIAAGLTIGTVTSQRSNCAFGTVIDQDPAAGTSVAAGTPVNLAIAVACSGLPLCPPTNLCILN